MMFAGHEHKNTKMNCQNWLWDSKSIDIFCTSFQFEALEGFTKSATKEDSLLRFEFNDI